jgi:TetR/AcrR family transcriptional repressor of nem operon
VGRKKSYDREVLIAKAMEVFRDHGFAGTSAETLCEALGVNRFSIYAEFGSKQALFDAALQRYDDEAVERNFGPLEAPGAGLKEIRSLLDFFGSARKSPAWGRGCLLCNTAVEFGPDDPSGSGFVKRYFKRLSAAFEAALTNARRSGDLHQSVDSRREAGFLTSSVLGMFVMLRARAPEAIIKGAAQSANDYLDTLRANPVT